MEKRKSRTTHKTDKIQERLSKREDAAKVAEVAIAALQLKWGCSRETAIYIQILENRVRNMQEAHEPLDLVSKVHMPKL